MTREECEQIAKDAYQLHQVHHATAHPTHRPLPPWHELSEEQRQAWIDLVEEMEAKEGGT